MPVGKLCFPPATSHSREPLADLLKEIHDQIVLGKISSKEELITTYKEEILGMSPIVINEDLSLIV